MMSHGHTRLSQVYANIDSVAYLSIIEFFSTTFVTPNDGMALLKCNPTELVIRKKNKLKITRILLIRI